ncbi:MAG: hypothetical protein WC979_02615 [Candidatus Pacearchaeota archaeon]|jgi:hypothetical protein|nr:hypothetical protein [Clostridia bacterium]
MEKSVEIELTNKVRTDLVKHLKDLLQKIETNEPFPEGEQTLSDLYEFDNRIEECLGCWYY